MPRKKQRETYGNGSVTPVMVKRLNADGSEVVGRDGKPERMQERDRDGKPVWRVCVTLGTETYVDKSGHTRRRQRKLQRRVHGSLADARKVCRELTDEYEHVDQDTARYEFSDVCQVWSDAMATANACSETQLRQYVNRLGYMAEQLDGKPVIEVKKADVERALAAVKTSRNLSNTTVNKVFAVTKRVFEYAVDSDMILRNPCRSVTPPKVDKVTSRRSLTSDEAARLRAYLDTDELAAYETFYEKERRQTEWGNLFGRSALRGLSGLSGLMSIRLMLATGCRRGESLALT